MMKYLLNIFLFFCASFTSFLQAQSIQLFTENFQLGGASFTLNGAGPGSNSGTNQWIINNTYNGVPTYPNTTSQDSTVSGTISFAPNSQYLHIYDSVSGITNSNYSPTVQSDKFACLTDGLCTYGMDSVHFSFFYLCEGSATAYGKVYYSIDNGPWIQTGLSQYNNKSKWKFEDITDPAFSNVGNLRFGFRWENNNANTSYSQSFAIDDINIVASYDPVVNPFTITIDSVSPSPICQGTFLSIFYTISDTLCDGSYTIDLSDSSGNFPGANSWVINIYYPTTSGSTAILLPNLVKPANCYKIRISRTSPQPAITGIASACFTILDCPNVITTLQPVITYDTNAVCVGSVIEVPFFSTGVYSFNTYTAELSDSDGTFPANPEVVGTFSNSSTYDPALPPGKPGTVSGKVPEVAPGCNYYIRVVSSNPVITGAEWGPFCIGHCDITTNDKKSLQFCVTECSAAPEGEDTTITVNINSYDSAAIYNSGNQYAVQLLSKKTFAEVGSTGAIGSVIALNDTTLKVHIPCKDSLAILGISPGSYYMRIIATNSSTPDNSLGTLVNITIGAPQANAPVIYSYDYNTFQPEDTFCTGAYVWFIFIPFNYFDMSTYQWQSPEFFGGNPFSATNLGLDPNSNSAPYVFTLSSAGNMTLKVQETNFGCKGPWSLMDTVTFLSTPAVPIAGPNMVCQGDTNHFEVSFYDNTYYNWTTTNATIIDTSNNEIDLRYNSLGTYQIKMNAINQCGLTTSSKIIQVKPYPTADAGNDTTICSNDTMVLKATTGAGYTYSWSDGINVLGTTNTVTVTPDITTVFFLTVTGQGGCKTMDTVKAVTLPPPFFDAGTDTFICSGSPMLLSTPYSSYYSYLWEDGTDTISVSNSTTVIPLNQTSYFLSVKDSSGCIGKDTLTVIVQPKPVANAGNDTTICELSNVLFSTPDSMGYSYLWSDGITTIGITSSLSVSPLGNSSYFLSVTDTFGCNSKDTIMVFVKAYPIADAGSDTTICMGESYLLKTQSGTNYTFTWFDGVNIIGNTNPISVTPSATTSFFLNVTEGGICEKKDTITIQVKTPSTSTISDSICIDGNSPITLISENGDAYFWSTGAYTKQITVSDSGTYSVSIKNTDSICEKIIFYNVLPKPCPDILIVFPNIFSPNGDGMNDFFTPISSAKFDTFIIKILNRWGSVIYESEEPFFQWNGKDKSGNPASDGVYYYIAETNLKSTERKYSGFVTLTR